MHTQLMKTFKAKAHSFKRFTSQILKLSVSLSMHLLPRMNVMLDFIWTLPVQLLGTWNKWTLQENLVNGRIRTINTARPPDYKSTVITIRPQLALFEIEFNVHEMYIYTTWTGACIYRINNVDCLLFQLYNVWILLKAVIKYLHWSICITIQMLYHG